MSKSQTSIGKNSGAQLGLPKFGSVLDRAQQFARLIDGFSIEMFRCFRQHNNNYQEVRILHIATDLSLSWDEMSKIIQQMEAKGFKIDPIWYPLRQIHEEWVDADVLLLGCDATNLNQAHDIIGEMRRGLLGIVTEWDLLWYFTDNIIPDATSFHTDQGGVCSGSAFSADGIYLVDTHIRRRRDGISKNGLIVDLSQRIESGIVKIVGLGPPRSDFHEKTERLKNMIGESGRDQELLFGTIEFMKSIRNRFAHPYDPEPGTKMRKAYADFKKTAQTHNFPVPLRIRDGHGSDEEDDHSYRKLLTILTGMVDVWLWEYDRSSANQSVPVRQSP